MDAEGVHETSHFPRKMASTGQAYHRGGNAGYWGYGGRGGMLQIAPVQNPLVEHCAGCVNLHGYDKCAFSALYHRDSQRVTLTSKPAVLLPFFLLGLKGTMACTGNCLQSQATPSIPETVTVSDPRSRFRFTKKPPSGLNHFNSLPLPSSSRTRTFAWSKRSF